jgi:hypothetical protein
MKYALPFLHNFIQNELQLEKLLESTNFIQKSYNRREPKQLPTKAQMSSKRAAVWMKYGLGFQEHTNQLRSFGDGVVVHLNTAMKEADDTVEIRFLL